MLNLEIVSPEKNIYDGKVKSVSIPGVQGLFQVLYNHAPIVSAFDIGIIIAVDSEGKTVKFSTSGGIVEVNKNNVMILADTAESSDEIDMDRAKAAFDRAKERINSGDKAINKERAMNALKRAKIRLSVIENKGDVAQG